MMSVEKLRNGSKKLRGRERLCQHDAVGDALGSPIFGVCAAHVDDRKFRVDLSGLLGDFPAVDLAG